MRIAYHGVNVEVTDGMKDHFEERIEKIRKYIVKVNDELIDVKVNFKIHADGQKCEVEVSMPHGQFHKAKSEEKDMYVAIDKATESILSSVRKEKEKTVRG